jgi:D-ala D-ala ligase C-terminus
VLGRNGAIGAIQLPLNCSAPVAKRLLWNPLLDATTSGKRAHVTVKGAGMARVDFFFADDGRVLVNEINTIPGFTNISMFPLLWEASGVSYSDLIDKLIMFALRRHAAVAELSYEVHQTAPARELPE